MIILYHNNVSLKAVLTNQAGQHLCAGEAGISIAFPAELEHLLPMAHP